jgi:hypothetical protein
MVEAEAGAGAFCTVMGGRGFADLPTYIHYEQCRLKEFPDAVLFMKHFQVRGTERLVDRRRRNGVKRRLGIHGVIALDRAELEIFCSLRSKKRRWETRLMTEPPSRQNLDPNFVKTYI